MNAYNYNAYIFLYLKSLKNFYSSVTSHLRGALVKFAYQY